MYMGPVVVFSTQHSRLAPSSTNTFEASPITRRLTLFFIRSGVSRSMAVAMRCISASTSACGRFQFSVLKAYRVR